jgi:putative FmdB family regulatory protein
MPIYEYECPECSSRQTLFRSIADRDKTVLCLEHGGDADCLTFNAPTMKRVISRGTGFLLKGGGWYKDGYGSQKPS